MERGNQAVGVRLRVDATAEVVIGVGAAAHLRRKDIQDGIATVNLRIAVVGLLDAHLGGMFHCITHAGLQIHGDGVLGLKTGGHHQKQGRQGGYSSCFHGSHQ